MYLNDSLNSVKIKTQAVSGTTNNVGNLNHILGAEYVLIHVGINDNRVANVFKHSDGDWSIHCINTSNNTIANNAEITGIMYYI